MTAADVALGLEDPEIANNQGDKWTFVAVLPDSGYIHQVLTAERTQEKAIEFVEGIKANSDGQAPLFQSDGWFYSGVLESVYSELVPVPYAGRGRPAHPIQVVDTALKYVQVCKERDIKGNIEKITTKIVIGEETEINKVFEKSIRCKDINTDYVESRNQKYRKDNARLIRKTMCHSKKAVFHAAQIVLLTGIFNYTRCVDTLKVLVDPKAKRFKNKYLHRTPAMAERLTDKVWTLKELLMKRPQKRIA